MTELQIDPKSEVGELYAKVANAPPTPTTRIIYKEFNLVFADLIKSYFHRNRDLKILDYGGGNGALSTSLANLLREFTIEFTNIDQSQDLLKLDRVSSTKIESRLESINTNGMPKYDVILMRYVLHYNTAEIQEKIIEKVKTLLAPNGIFILQHAGTTNLHHKELVNRMNSNKHVPKLARSTPNWSTWEEIEAILSKAELKTTLIRRYCLPIGDLFKVRYNLSESEEAERQEITNSYDFLEYTISISSVN